MFNRLEFSLVTFFQIENTDSHQRQRGGKLQKPRPEQGWIHADDRPGEYFNIIEPLEANNTMKLTYDSISVPACIIQRSHNDLTTNDAAIRSKNPDSAENNPGIPIARSCRN